MKDNPYQAPETDQHGSKDSRPSITLPVFGSIPLRPRDMLADLKIKDNPPLWAQFFKYVVCGLVATLVLALVWLLARTCSGGYLDDDLPKATLQSHSTVVLINAFVIANFVAYFSNRIFVFTPGRHTFFMEMFIFFAVSAASFFGGHLAKTWLIEQGHQVDLAALSFAVSSALINFIARKYIVFSNPSSSATN